MSGAIYGIHPVLEALRVRGDRVQRVVVAEGRHDRRFAEILEAARAAGVPVQRQPDAAVDRLAGGGRHQGVVAFVGGSGWADPDDVVRRAGSPALFVVLDGVEDPRNLGAVIRSAAAAGADGVFVPERGATGLTEACAKASAGAVERIPVARIGNVVAFLKSLKKNEIWVIGVDPGGETPWTGFDLTVPVALVLGSEGTGLRRLARETCDLVVSIPLRSGVESLNLSVAAGVVLFEAVRQRLAAAGRKGTPGAAGTSP